MGATAIISLVGLGLSLLSSVVTPLIIARRNSQSQPLPSGVPMPPAGSPPVPVQPPAVVQPVPSGSHPVLDALAQALLSHQTADALGQILGSAVAGMPSTPASGGSQVATALMQLAPEILQAIKAFAPPPPITKAA
jgi:hypothetical protein